MMAQQFLEMSLLCCDMPLISSKFIIAKAFVQLLSGIVLKITHRRVHPPFKRPQRPYRVRIRVPSRAAFLVLRVQCWPCAFRFHHRCDLNTQWVKITKRSTTYKLRWFNRMGAGNDCTATIRRACQKYDRSRMAPSRHQTRLESNPRLVL
jgi:hypothetical protein